MNDLTRDVLAVLGGVALGIVVGPMLWVAATSFVAVLR